MHTGTTGWICRAALLTGASALVGVTGAAEASPSIRDVLSVPVAGSPAIAPDGSAVAYTVRTTEWESNRFDTEIHVVSRGGESTPLTFAEGDSSTGPKWSPDSQWIAYTTGGSQIHLVSAEGGEPIRLTAFAGGVMDFAWSPDGKSMGILIPDPPAHLMREAAWGQFTNVEVDAFRPHLWLLDVEAARESEGGVTRGSPALRNLTGGNEFVVRSFVGAHFDFSPDGGEIVFTHVPDPGMASMFSPDISIVDVATGQIRPLVAGPGFQAGGIYSADGEWVIFYELDMTPRADRPSPFTANRELARVPADGGAPETLTGEWDEHVVLIDYTAFGVRFVGNIGTTQHIYRLDPDTRAIEPIVSTPNAIDASVSVTGNGAELAYVGFDGDTLDEVYVAAAPDYRPTRLTDNTNSSTADWPSHTSQTLRWESFDGLEIEGVLIKPATFDELTPHPLIVLLHGGPVFAEMPRRLYNWEYPVAQWLNDGALILLPNYRGSNGYGQAFRSLTYRAGGLPSAQDVDAAVDHLVEARIADPQRVGVGGWSYGGYLSVYLLGISDRYQAISVGAGPTHSIVGFATSDTYVGARMGHGAWPWEDPELYRFMSPIHLMYSARTPTLIQHGRNDARVPYGEASLLFRTLKHMGHVDVRLYAFDDMGHMLSRPKERLAAQWQNYNWFSKYVWGDEVPLPWE